MTDISEERLEERLEALKKELVHRVDQAHGIRADGDSTLLGYIQALNIAFAALVQTLAEERPGLKSSLADTIRSRSASIPDLAGDGDSLVTARSRALTVIINRIKELD